MSAPTFGRTLFAGGLDPALVLPYPQMDPAEAATVARLVRSLESFAAESYDPAKVEADRWVGDDVIAGLAERGLMGLAVPAEHGGAGLSHTGYARVSEAFGRIDPTLSVVMGVHQSLGTKAVLLGGDPEQRARLLPDLAAGRKLAGFGLTEPGAGSDAFGIRTRARRRPDGAWVLNGEKRWIGNGNRDVLVTFARVDDDQGGGHVALVLERGMPGWESPFRYPTLGLSGNDNRHVVFRDVVVPAANVLGEPGQGLRLAVSVLNQGRIGLGTGSVGIVKRLLEMALAHTGRREQFGRPLAGFELVQEKLGWMVAELYGLESFAYLVAGLADRGVRDVAADAALLKVTATEFLWYATNRVVQLVGGLAYMRDQPYEKILRDVRIFPIFEGANDVLRTFAAERGLSRVARRGPAAADLRGFAPGLDGETKIVAAQLERMAAASGGLLARHGDGVAERQLDLAALSEAATGVAVQVATLARRSSGTPAGDEAAVGRTATARAAARADAALDRLERGAASPLPAIARAAATAGGYAFDLHPAA